jgi:uncharacterized protein (DUF433 family)
MGTVVSSDPNVMHGTPCFKGTRVPVRSLFDHLEEGYGIGAFLVEFASVERQQVLDLLAALRDNAERMATRISA